MTKKEFNKELIKLLSKDRSTYYFNYIEIGKLLRTYITEVINKQENKFDNTYLTDVKNLLLLSAYKVLEDGSYKHSMIDQRISLNDIFKSINEETISVLFQSDLLISTEHIYIINVMENINLF